MRNAEMSHMSEGPIPLHYAEEASERRKADRRFEGRTDRRAPKLRLDPLFAATLVNQIAREETPYAHGYAQTWRGPKPGIVVNVKA